MTRGHHPGQRHDDHRAPHRSHGRYDARLDRWPRRRLAEHLLHPDPHAVRAARRTEPTALEDRQGVDQEVGDTTVTAEAIQAAILDECFTLADAARYGAVEVEVELRKRLDMYTTRRGKVPSVVPAR